MIFQPDNWVIIEINKAVSRYHVLAGWNNNSIFGVTWKLSSNIETFEQNDDQLDFIGSCDDIYRCSRQSYCLLDNTSRAWSEIKLLHGNNCKLMTEKTCWANLFQNN